VRKAGLFKALRCQLAFIRQIEPQRQFGRVPTQGITGLRGLSRRQQPLADRAAGPRKDFAARGPRAFAGKLTLKAAAKVAP